MKLFKNWKRKKFLESYQAKLEDYETRLKHVNKTALAYNDLEKYFEDRNNAYLKKLEDSFELHDKDEQKAYVGLVKYVQNGFQINKMIILHYDIEKSVLESRIEIMKKNLPMIKEYGPDKFILKLYNNILSKDCVLFQDSFEKIVCSNKPYTFDEIVEKGFLEKFKEEFELKRKAMALINGPNELEKALKGFDDDGAGAPNCVI